MPTDELPAANDTIAANDPPDSPSRPDRTSSVRTSLVDSPWFWLHLFAIAGLIALLLMGPKFGSRQAQIERQYQGRTQALLPADQRDAELRLSSRDDTIITLAPLYVGLGGVGILAWVMLWRQRFSGRRNSILEAAKSP